MIKILYSVTCILFLNFALSQYNPTIFADPYNGSDIMKGVSNLYFSTVCNGKLYFNVADDSDYKLYVTDGNTSNLTLLKTVPQVLNLVAFDNQVFFSYIDPVNGAELWKTDGTVNGTTKVLILGGNAMAPVFFTISSNKLYFASGNSINNFVRQLYVMNSASSSPILLRNDLVDVINLYPFNNKILFAASNEVSDSYLKRELYISDGTEAGTTLVKDINAGVDGSNPSNFYKYNNKVYFKADEATTGSEIWFTDGTSNGTQILKDIYIGTNSSLMSLVAGEYNGKLYFTANDGINGAEPWVTDGTSANTVLFKDINPIGASGAIGYLKINGKMLISANDNTNGFELWISDGTSQNTVLIKDIAQGSESAVYGLKAKNLICSDKLFFDAGNSIDIEPWVTDGTEEGTVKIADLNPSGSSLDYETDYVYFNNKIFFSAQSGNGRVLYSMEPNCQPLSLNEEKIDISIYPNPTNGKTVIKTIENINEIKIFNISGVLISHFNNFKYNEIDLNEFESGTYFVEIKFTNDKTLKNKILLIK